MFPKRILVVLALCTVTRFAMSATPDTYNPGAGWRLVWSDEFNGSSVNTADWNYETGGGGWGNSELQIYTTNNSPVAGGELVITATKNADGSYNSARLTTKDKRFFTYGKIVARIRLPYGKGIWPAFWTLGQNISSVGWPSCGELDILEMVGGGENKDDTMYGSIHWMNGAGQGHLNNGAVELSDPQSFYQDYHHFEVEWNAAWIIWRLDGNELYRQGINARQYPEREEFRKPHFLILNCAVGGQWPGNPDATTVFPQRMYVDWVRVYDEVNLLQNGNFNAPLAGTWSTWTHNGGWVGQSTNASEYYDGTPCAFAGGGESGGEKQSAGLYQIVPAEPGVPYTLSCDSSVAAWWWPSAEMRMSFLDSTDALLLETNLNCAAAIAGYDRGLPWSNYRLFATSPAGTARIKVQLSCPGHGTVYFDNAILTPHQSEARVVRQLTIPGRIEAEDYDADGPELSYSDTTLGNSGGVYRQEDVDIQATTDVGGGYNIGWTGSGEWLHYTLDVKETGVYQIALRVASMSPANIQLTLDGLPLCGLQTPVTGDWQNWQTVTVSNITLQAGQRLLRLSFQNGGCNLNYLQFVKTADLAGFLKASGKQIVDGQGQNILLRGMGLGNWMLQEPYMMDASGIVDTQQQLKSKIAELVGTNNMLAFYRSWLTNYMREADVAALATNGFNSIRLPIHFNLLTLPVDQEPIPGQNTWLQSGFDLIDALLGWCESNRIYLILDMHGCPGGQGYDKPISDYNPPAPSLWESPANKNKLIALWREIARRYVTKQWIGGYDVINEPNWTFENRSSINGCDDQTNAPLRQLLIDITAAIRQVDTNHIIFLAGNCWGGNYNGILPPWDPNLVISFHKYWDDPSPASFQGRVDLRDQWNMPLWLGESGENSNEWFRNAIQSAEQLNIGWCWWPWKKINSAVGTVGVRKPAGYQRILDYWRGNGPRPSTNEAAAALLELAQQTRLENCEVHRDVFDAMLRPIGTTKAFVTNRVPGVVFAADYDLGRQGQAFFDTTTDKPHNTGRAYRNDSVDIEVCNDSLPSNGYSVGWLEASEWMNYTLTPVALGPYEVFARVAAPSAGGKFYLEVGGSNVTGVITVPATGGWSAWKTISAGLVSQPHVQSFRFVVLSGGFNLHWLTFQKVQEETPDRPLKAVPSGTNLMLSWPASVAPGLNLYTAPDLRPPIAWSRVTNEPVAGTSDITITLPIRDQMRFFRLAEF